VDVVLVLKKILREKFKNNYFYIKSNKKYDILFK